MLLYYDDLWPSIYKSKSVSALECVRNRINATFVIQSCEERQRVLKEEKYQVLRLHPSSKAPKCELVDNRIKCSQSAVFNSTRERWWYVVVSNCGSQRVIRLRNTLAQQSAQLNVRFSPRPLFARVYDSTIDSNSSTTRPLGCVTSRRTSSVSSTYDYVINHATRAYFRCAAHGHRVCRTLHLGRGVLAVSSM